MNQERRHIHLGFCSQTILEGQHLCYIYNDDVERRNVMAKYLESGLLDGENVLYLVDDITPDEMIVELEKLGVDIQTKRKALHIQEAMSAYCPTGFFKIDEMLDAVKDFYLSSLAKGYVGSRGTGEMSWCLVEGRANPVDVMEYEARLNFLVEQYPYTACCQYDAKRFDGETIMDILNVHPYMIVRGQLVSNPYYIAPNVFLEEYRNRKNPH